MKFLNELMRMTLCGISLLCALSGRASAEDAKEFQQVKEMYIKFRDNASEQDVCSNPSLDAVVESGWKLLNTLAASGQPESSQTVDTLFNLTQMIDLNRKKSGCVSIKAPSNS